MQPPSIQILSLFSIDVMGKPIGAASQWADSSSLGSRASFRWGHTVQGFLFSIVVMGKPIGAASQWADSSSLGSRASFRWGHTVQG
jgi:hypothetical protein